MSPCSGLAGDRGDRNIVISCSVSFPPPSSPSRKAIEDVWRDISLSFLRDRDPISIHAAILQDLMSSKGKPLFGRATESAHVSDVSLVDSPATCLSLSSGCHEATMTDGALHADKRDDPCNRKHKRQIKNRELVARS